MTFSRKSDEQEKNLKYENAVLRNALEVILSEIESERPESAKVFALMALRGERHDEVTEHSREIYKMRVYSTEHSSSKMDFLTPTAGVCW